MKAHETLIAGWAVWGLMLTACATVSPAPPTEAHESALPQATQWGEGGAEIMTFEMTSPAFEHSQAIPLKYTCDGEDRSPPLQWTDPPSNTVSFAMVMDDPDAPAGTWDHWILFNIPNHLRSLPEGVAPRPELKDGSRHGGNSWRRTEYGGPCPPSGTHRYFFKLFALDSMLDLPAGASKAALLAAIQGHILAQAELMGTYSR